MSNSARATIQWFPCDDYPTPAQLTWVLEAAMGEAALHCAVGDRVPVPLKTAARKLMANVFSPRGVVDVATGVAWESLASFSGHEGNVPGGDASSLCIAVGVIVTHSRLGLVELHYRSGVDVGWRAPSACGFGRAVIFDSPEAARGSLMFTDKDSECLLQLAPEEVLRFNESERYPGNLVGIRQIARLLWS